MLPYVPLILLVHNQNKMALLWNPESWSQRLAELAEEPRVTECSSVDRDGVGGRGGCGTLKCTLLKFRCRQPHWAAILRIERHCA